MVYFFFSFSRPIFAPPFPGRVLLEPDIRKAVDLALSLSAGRTPIVIAGSLFLIGEVKRLRLF